MLVLLSIDYLISLLILSFSVLVYIVKIHVHRTLKIVPITMPVDVMITRGDPNATIGFQSVQI
jgi:hypothetical protein